MSLSALGWTPFFESQIEGATREGQVPARVMAEEGGLFRLSTEDTELEARLRGRLRHTGEIPVAGDWVLASITGGASMIERVLERRTQIARKVAGQRVDEQVLAANVDAAWIVMALDGDFSLRRLERYLVTVREGGVEPVIVLNKCDLDGAMVEARSDECRRTAIDARVFAVSAASGAGMACLVAETMTPGRTIAVLGSSGVGKSTLVNMISGRSDRATDAVRASDGTGRHTTSGRAIVRIEGGSLLVDTPGLRELQLWESSSGLEATFSEIGELASACRFRDCRHEREPGCAVLEAIEAGILDPSRLRSWRALERELARLERKREASTRASLRRSRNPRKNAR
jgi:ribosome biogenesis GTPase / thiamine phosphate phosphatase